MSTLICKKNTKKYKYTTNRVFLTS